MMPRRFQLRRTKGWKMPPNTANVARPGKYGNHHRIGFCQVCGVEHTRGEAIAEFRSEIEASPELQRKIREHLAGKNVACWCHLNEACHGDVLLEVANAAVTGAESVPSNGVEMVKERKEGAE